MLRRFLLFLLLALALLIVVVEVASQEVSIVNVKGYELNNGVVILDIVKAGKTYELQCNQGLSDCAPLRNGTYLMVELPQNFGMYHCKNVDLYPESATTSEGEKKLGEYCLIPK